MTLVYIAIWMFAAASFLVAITAVYGAAIQITAKLDDMNAVGTSIPTRLRNTKMVRSSVGVKPFEPNTRAKLLPSIRHDNLKPNGDQTRKVA